MTNAIVNQVSNAAIGMLSGESPAQFMMASSSNIMHGINDDSSLSTNQQRRLRKRKRVFSLMPSDVVCDQYHSSSHSGSVSYRQLVEDNRDTYVASISNNSKVLVAKMIVGSIYEQQGQFYKSSTSSSSLSTASGAAATLVSPSSFDKTWTVVPPEKAVLRTIHLLDHKSN